MRGLKLTLLTLFIIFLVGWFGGQYYLSGSVADYHGELDIRGLAAPVEVTFDSRGIPQIWAESSADMYLTLGYLHASERLFQMELIRRVSHGELSELIGTDGLEFDKTVRTLGFSEKAKTDAPALSKQSVELINSYITGINAWIENASVLPPEFVLAGIEPKPWTEAHVLTNIVYQTWFSHALVDQDSTYHKLIATLGEDAEAKLTGFRSWSPTTVPQSFTDAYFSGEAFPLRATKASNSWVVSPQKSNSGAALHASDPHLLVTGVPNFWYIVGMHTSDGANFVGVTLPSVPAGLMGHTDSIAFAFTVSTIDLNDSFSVRKTSTDSVTIFGKTEALRVREEYISIAGEPAQKINIKTTSLGPVVAESDTDYTVTHWAGYDFNYSEVASSMLNLIHATNFDDFRAVVTKTGALDANWTYSDINGNIGYQLGAPVPRRELTNTYSVLSASNERAKWRGYLPLDSIPFAYNPAENFITSNNNQIATETFPANLNGFYDPYRVLRATELLSADAAFSADDMTRFQLDRISVVAQRFKADIAAAADQLGNVTLAEDFREWNGELTLDSDLPSIFTAWWYFLPKFITEDDLGTEWEMAARVLDEIVSDKENPLFDNRITEKKESRDEVLAQCLAYVLETYKGKSFAEVMTLEIKHPFALGDDFRSTFLDYFLGLNRGPHGFASDNSTLNVGYYTKKKNSHGFAVQLAASMRYVLDWSDIDRFSIYTNLGQSGNPLSPHYSDFLRDWLAGKSWNVPFTKETVYEKRKSLLRLK